MGFFDLVHRRSLVYNQCWEDPAVDRQALRLDETDRVFVITSAGCNALDYALLGARVVAVDMNPRQNHLLELKLAGIRALGHPAFFDLFGRGGSREARAHYAALRQQLPEPSRRFWDHEIRLFEPMGARSFYYRGTAGFVAWLVRHYIDDVARVRPIVERLLEARDLAEQGDLYRSELRPRLLGERLLRLFGSPVLLALLGVPPAQRRLVVATGGSVGRYIAACLDHVMSVALLRDNYFWRVYVTGGYTQEVCPEYLKPDNFARLRQGLVDRVSTSTATVTAYLARERESFSAFVLLDHMDWLAPHRGLLEAEWEQIFAAATPGARVIFRSGALDASFLPAAVRGRLAFDRERAQALHRQDRVGTYASFHIARLDHA